MANAPQPNIYGVGSTVASGTYPIFAAKDSAGNYVLPYVSYFWNGTAWQVRSLVTLNSTTTALTANSVYTSSTVDISTFGKLTGTIYADQAGTLLIKQSFDGTNWDTQYQLSYNPATSSGSISVPVTAPNLSVVYTNGATAQTAFRLYIGGQPL